MTAHELMSMRRREREMSKPRYNGLLRIAHYAKKAD